MIQKLISFLIVLNCVFGALLPEEKSKDLQNEIDILSAQLERFNVHYVTTFEQKLSSLLSTVTTIDTNLKALQEKAHVWDIFRHHIDAWTDHLKSVDHKIDLIKRTQDENNSIENKLNSLEFAVNHILSKVDLMNEKNREIEPKILQKLIDIYKIVYNRERADGYEKKEMLIKLTTIMRHVLAIENNNCRSSRNTKPNQLLEQVSPDNSKILREIQSKLNGLSDKISTKDIKQLASNGKKNSQHIENIVELVRSVDERTMRLFDAEASHSAKILQCCEATSNEVATFASSADLLLKRIELMIVQEKVEKVTPQPQPLPLPELDRNEKSSSEAEIEASTEIESDIDEKDETSTFKDTSKISSSFGNKTDDQEFTETKEIDSVEVIESTESEFIQPLKSGCHEIKSRVDGVYKLSDPSLNEAGRDFNERYCTFRTDGLGWTVIQRRGSFDSHENFNRSWVDYKMGFGDLEKEFWFGNEFIHRLSKNSFELRIELEDFEGLEVWAEYSVFEIGSEQFNYNLMIGGYRGGVADSMLYHHNMDFSTYDRRNDKSEDDCCSCAVGYGSGWWYDNCSEANLNGIYHDTPLGHNYIGIIWEHWHGDYSLKKTRMLVRPVDVWLKEDDASEIFPEVPEDP